MGCKRMFRCYRLSGPDFEEDQDSQSDIGFLATRGMEISHQLKK